MDQIVPQLIGHPAAAWATWLQTRHWQLFVTPTFRTPHSAVRALARVERWVQALGPDTYAFLAVERGGVGGRVHVHGLVGGLPRTGLGRTWAEHAIAKWSRGDDLEVRRYDPRRGGAAYVVKDLEDYRIVGTLRRHAPRRR